MNRATPVPPSDEALARLAAIIAPGGRVERVARLGGGAMMAMHAVDMRDRSGTLRRIVVRRAPAGTPPVFAEFLAHGWRVLEMLASLNLPAPRPIFADLAGAIFDGEPSVVITRERGSSHLVPANVASWSRGLGEALAALHATPLDRLPSGVLSEAESFVDDLFDQMEPSPDGGTRFDALAEGRALVATMQAWRPKLTPLAPAFIHGDYCPENTLWFRGRLTAIVDWDFARIDHPGVDVGYCRAGLALVFGMNAADAFLAGYETACGRPWPEPFFWDLLGAGYTLPDPAARLRRYRALGRRDLTAALLRERLAGFIRSAVERAG